MSNTKNEQEYQLENKETYIDSNLLIYSVIDIGEKGEKARKVIEKIKDGDYKAYTSTLTLDEVMWIVQNQKDKETAYESAKTIMDIPNLHFISVNIETIMKALEIYNKNKLNPRDSIHLAAIKEKNLKMIMSSDSDFDKIEDLKRIDFTK